MATFNLEHNGQRRAVTVTQECPNGIGIRIEGYGVCDMNPGDGTPIYIELYEGRIRCAVWNDIRSDNSTVIDLEAALETNREVEEQSPLPSTWIAKMFYDKAEELSAESQHDAADAVRKMLALALTAEVDSTFFEAITQIMEDIENSDGGIHIFSYIGGDMGDRFTITVKRIFS
jgi:hypothetical protein